MASGGSIRRPMAERTRRSAVAAQGAPARHRRARHPGRLSVRQPDHPALLGEDEDPRRCSRDECPRRRGRGARSAHRSGDDRERGPGPDLPDAGCQGCRGTRSRRRARVQPAAASPAPLAGPGGLVACGAESAALDSGGVAREAARHRCRRASASDADRRGDGAPHEGRNHRPGHGIRLGAGPGALARDRGHRAIDGAEACRRGREHALRPLSAGAARGEVRSHPAGQRLAQRTGAGAARTGGEVRAARSRSTAGRTAWSRASRQPPPSSSSRRSTRNWSSREPRPRRPRRGCDRSDLWSSRRAA